MSNLRKSTIASGLALALGMGVAGQASAGIYAGASLNTANLAILFNPFNPGVDPVIGQYDFGTTSTAGVAPGGGDASIAVCTGNFANGSTSCGAGPVLYTGLAGNTIVGSGPAEYPGGTAIPLSAQAPQTIAQVGPTGSGNWAVADSIIDTATLVTGGTTNVRQSSEAEINSAESALSDSRISSTTSFTYGFSLQSAGDMIVSFLADPDLMALFDDDDASDATATASTSWQLELSSNDAAAGALSITWTPTFASAANSGCEAGNVTALGSVACVDDIVWESLNESVTAPGPLPFSLDEHSHPIAGDDGLQQYGLHLGGLTAGNYSLSLTSLTTAIVSRVPAPGSLLLVGAGLALLGMRGRGRKA